MRSSRVWAPLVAFMLLGFSDFAQAQRPAARFSGPITGQGQQVLPGSRPPRATAAADVGALAGDTPIPGITLVFSRSAAQEAALGKLLAAQQDPSSPLFHQWLTPETFGAQFGVADTDLLQAEAWLQAQGFTIDRVTRAHDRISFSGTAAQVNAAFGTALHRYVSGSRVDYAPSTDLSLPSGLAPMVAAVAHLATFRPHSMVRRAAGTGTAAYTTTGAQTHFLTPKDVATLYDVNAVYNGGYTGAGQTLAIAGQSFVQTADVANFQTAVGLPANVPKLVLEPGTGGSGVYQGDEFESDIDLEYSTGMAPAANVLFVYTGDSPNYGVFDAFDYIIEENLAPVASISYGSCEPLTGQSFVNAASQLFAQGAAQGQTLIASAGDQGSTECFGSTDNNGNSYSTAIEQGLSTNFPADSPYVTSIGGTQMAPGTFTAGNTQYWASAGSTPVVSSLLSYVPEVVWNEDSASYGFASGGGGASIYFSAPTWQAGVAGIPSTNTARLNPDISLQAATSSPGYLACSSDPSSFQTGQASSCTNGVYDTTGKFVEEAGGTSFGAPIFAGLMAVLNQQQQSTGHGAANGGQGLVNPALYGLAKGPGYATIFHDITLGNNGCAALPADCSFGVSAFPAGAGYDEASGLGSIDFANLVAAWPASTATMLAGSSITLTPATGTPVAGAADAISIAVSSATGTPTGTVTVSLANEGVPTVTNTISTSPGATVAATLPLSNGQASYNFPGTLTPGTEVVVVTYSGDATHAASTASVPLTVANTLTPTGSFTFSVGGVSVPANGVGQSTILITPTAGYNGLINFNIPTLPTADCFATSYSAVAGLTNVTLYVGNGTACTTGAAVKVGHQAVVFPRRVAGVNPQKTLPGTSLESVFAGVLLVGFASWRRRRRVPALFGLVLLAGLGFGLSGCGGSGTPTPAPTPVPGPQVLSLTLTGTDSVTTTITNSASLSVTIQ